MFLWFFSLQFCANETETETPDNDSQTSENIEKTTEEPFEIFTPPDVSENFITANLTDIASGNVFSVRFMRGVNIGNMLETSDENAWGIYSEPDYLPIIKQRGFDFVRLSLNWKKYIINKDGEIIIDETFLGRIKDIIDETLKNDLGIILNVRYFNDADGEPEENENAEKLYKIWRIVSGAFQNYPASVVFDVYSEPFGDLDAKSWNEYQNECVKTIRETNPVRKIIITGGKGGGISDIMDLLVPEDENLILSFCFYEPVDFVYYGREWTGSNEEKQVLENYLKKVKAWSEASGLPAIMGEFGTYSKADMKSRARWTAYMRETAEYYGFAWSYRDFCSDFGIYDYASGKFYKELADALTAVPLDENVCGTGVGTPKIIAERGLGYIGPFETE